MVSYSKKLSEFSANGKSVTIDPLQYGEHKYVEGSLVMEGQKIHTNTGGENDLEEVWLYATNNSKYPTGLDLQWGTVKSRKDAIPTRDEEKQEFIDNYWKVKLFGYSSEQGVPGTTNDSSLAGTVTNIANLYNNSRASFLPLNQGGGPGGCRDQDGNEYSFSQFGDISDIWSDKINEDGSRMVFMVGRGVGLLSYHVDVNGYFTARDQHVQKSIKKGYNAGEGHEANCEGELPDPVAITGYRVGGVEEGGNDTVTVANGGVGGGNVYTDELFLVVVHDHGQITTYHVQTSYSDPSNWGELTLLDTYTDDHEHYQERDSRFRAANIDIAQRQMSWYGQHGRQCDNPLSHCNYDGTAENEIYCKSQTGNDLRYTGVEVVYIQDERVMGETRYELGPSAVFICVSARSRELEPLTEYNDHTGYQHHTWNGDKGGIYLFRVHHNTRLRKVGATGWGWGSHVGTGELEKKDHKGVPLPDLTDEEKEEVTKEKARFNAFWEGFTWDGYPPGRPVEEYFPADGEGGVDDLGRTLRPARMGDEGAVWHTGKVAQRDWILNMFVEDSSQQWVGGGPGSQQFPWQYGGRQSGPPNQYRQATTIGVGDLAVDESFPEGEIWTQGLECASCQPDADDAVPPYGVNNRDNPNARKLYRYRKIAKPIFLATRHDSYAGVIGGRSLVSLIKQVPAGLTTKLFNTVSMSTFVPKIQSTYLGEGFLGGADMSASSDGDPGGGLGHGVMPGNGDHAYLEHVDTCDLHRFTEKLSVIRDIWVDPVNGFTYVTEGPIDLDNSTSNTYEAAGLGCPNSLDYCCHKGYHIETPTRVLGTEWHTAFPCGRGDSLKPNNIRGELWPQRQGNLVYPEGRGAPGPPNLDAGQNWPAGGGWKWPAPLIDQTSTERYNALQLKAKRCCDTIPKWMNMPAIWVFDASGVPSGRMRGNLIGGTDKEGGRYGDGSCWSPSYRDCNFGDGVLPLNRAFLLDRIPLPANAIGPPRIEGIWADETFVYASGSWTEYNVVDHPRQSWRASYGLFVFSIDETGALSYIGTIINTDDFLSPEEAAVSGGNAGNCSPWQLSRRSTKLWGDNNFIYAASGDRSGMFQQHNYSDLLSPGAYSAPGGGYDGAFTGKGRAINVYEKLTVKLQKDQEIKQVISPRSGLSLVIPGILLKNGESIYAKADGIDGSSVTENTQNIYMAINRLTSS